MSRARRSPSGRAPVLTAILLVAATHAVTGDQTVTVGPGLAFSPATVTVAPGDRAIRRTLTGLRVLTVAVRASPGEDRPPGRRRANEGRSGS